VIGPVRNELPKKTPDITQMTYECRDVRIDIWRKFRKNSKHYIIILINCPLLVTANIPSSPILSTLIVDTIRFFETSVLAGATLHPFQKTAFFIVTAVRTSDLNNHNSNNNNNNNNNNNRRNCKIQPQSLYSHRHVPVWDHDPVGRSNASRVRAAPANINIDLCMCNLYGLPA
jgi:hypothetical protein